MADVNDYDDAAVGACFSVLLEFFTILGEYRESLVLVGGWTAAMIISEPEEKHIGTTDIDVIVDFRQIPDTAYETILRLLNDRGYRQDEHIQHRFLRELDDGREVAIDFLAGEYGGTGRSRRHQRVQDVKARKARGGDLVFDNCVNLTLRGELSSRITPGAVRD